MDGGIDPELSVVIAVFNGGSLLEEQLTALAEQVDAPPFEVIVSDNGSTDDSARRALSFVPRLHLRIIDASSRRGQTFARNAGAQAARGKALVFLDQDDVASVGYLAAMAEALTVGPFVAARMETDRLNEGWVAQVRTLAQTEALPTAPAPWGYGCTRSGAQGSRSISPGPALGRDRGPVPLWSAAAPVSGTTVLTSPMSPGRSVAVDATGRRRR